MQNPTKRGSHPLSATSNFHGVDGLTMEQVKMQYLPASPAFLLLLNVRAIGLLDRPEKFACRSCKRMNAAVSPQAQPAKLIPSLFWPTLWSSSLAFEASSMKAI